ncbi:MAG: MdtA/MuxA family multidrug efflux RND transporter periplasmic adaptor subunit [Pantoea ananatis]|jgi:multidrug efflux system membrane fusion protein|uniref:Multidrug resistance protein MdtA n=2 Tax=Pantoea ananas TaxID=553 RepID=A0A0H3L2Y7_PANAA|nr:MdtA/MuxA family multidrug efflux RND transporter periplasmic adaptor subunit [Pantoea ananatis]CCF11213.1 multidrug efflux system subunit MdtA [Pantoea ananatis LMG 5342]BAK13706.1 multidrug resistance protein MdtA precursor [Pantoea ananatis AJ13355]NCU10300.1 MdtA/MuxA family multidrug efflux RND transporter periplasmic adaptor subunit [Pantoea ananatis]NEK81879.1 MdtA/MuxA family multidrug efflux RND transporter periplasmic adaptor subunit [Pantoea ananatis]
MPPIRRISFIPVYLKSSMTTHAPRTRGSRWLKWLLLLIALLIVAAVAWRLMGHKGAGGTLPARGHAGRHGGPGMLKGGTTLVHSGTASTADVPVYLYALGTVIPNASVTVTSRVDGQLEKVYFTEGQKVEAGQLLAQIDPRSYEATLNQYQGELSENMALLKSAELTLARYRKLAAQDSLSRQDLDTQIATVGQYRGAVAADQAQIASARLNIGYARITAPVSGRVGLRQVDPGNMIQSASTTGLVTITQMQPAAVTFSVPQSHIPTLVKALHHDRTLPATAFDQDNQHALSQGQVKFISNEIDTATGTITLKAMFANDDEALYANQFVNLRLQTSVLKGATIIPAQALQLSSDGSFVFIINKDNTVTRQPVTAGPAYGETWQAILQGVKPGDRLVTEGIDRLTNGSKVSVADSTQPTPPAEAQ